MSDFNASIIQAFRDNGGLVMEPVPFGRGLVLVHTAKRDGSERVNPLAAVVDDGAWHVVGTAAGNPKEPVWAAALRRTSETDIEVPGEPERHEPVRTVRVRVSELQGDDRDRLWLRFLETSPAFAEYTKRARGRVFPIFRLDAV